MICTGTPVVIVCGGSIGITFVRAAGIFKTALLGTGSNQTAVVTERHRKTAYFPAEQALKIFPVFPQLIHNSALVHIMHIRVSQAVAGNFVPCVKLYRLFGRKALYNNAFFVCPFKFF